MSQLHKLLPSFLSQIYEFDAILSSEEEELEELEVQRYNHLDNLFALSAQEYGIARLENIYKIYPSSSQTLEERRFVLKAMMKPKVPATMNFLKEYLKGICGESGYSLSLDSDNYSLDIELLLPNKYVETAVIEFIENLIPANIVLDLQVDYSQNEALQLQTGG